MPVESKLNLTKDTPVLHIKKTLPRQSLPLSAATLVFGSDVNFEEVGNLHFNVRRPRTKQKGEMILWNQFRFYDYF